MELLDELIASGRIVTVMGAFVVVEVVALLVYRARTGRGVPAAPLLANIGAGGSLMLAFGAALRGAGTLVIAGWLLSALVFHVTDLALRWRR